VKVWTREIAMRRAQETQNCEQPTNPIFLLAAITLGIPALLMIPLIGMNPGVQDGTIAQVLTFLVVSTFVIAAVFEIKRLADQPSDANHH
jgi:membrane protease YdiL (CAAX protease family)